MGGGGERGEGREKDGGEEVRERGEEERERDCDEPPHFSTSPCH